MKQNNSTMRHNHHFTKKRSIKAGMPPGSLVHIGDTPTNAVGISTICYNPTVFQEQSFATLDDCLPHLEQPGITWLNIEGVHDVEIIRRLGERFSLHPLVLEDIVNTVQRPKIEDYGAYIFIVARMIRFSTDHAIETEQVSLVLGPGYVLSFQEGLDGDVFETVRERIRNGRGRIRTLGSDYLIYALIDAIVDSYFSVLEDMGELVEDLEEELAQGPNQEILKRLIGLKREIIFMRKGIWPLREVTAALERGESELITDASRIYFRDIYDHTIQVIDGVETFRDLLSGMLDLYLSSISNRTNEIMKFLTVVGTIFLPLTFIVGVYGMNFKDIPELQLQHGYLYCWIVMIAIALGMVVFFKKRRWL
jgi:magnesium transporter